ncbi:MAG: DUF4129 domain-containing protein [Candidatus Dormibacteraceae bacterium]
MSEVTGPRDQPGGDRLRRLPLARLAAVGVAAAVLLTVVALASRSRPLPLAAVPGPPRILGDSILLLAVAAWLGLMGMLVWAVVTQDRRHRTREARLRTGLRAAIAQLAFTLALALLWARYHPHFQGLRRAPPPAVAGPGRSGPRGVATPSASGFDWPALLLVAALLAAVAAVLLIRSRRRPAAPEPAGEGFAGDLAESLAELEIGADPRRAIIAAYGRMERALAGQGVPRRPSEAPLEYMARALVGLGAGAGPAARLTDLFELAKFSHHDITQGMREEAIDALRAVRDELGAAAA